MSEFEPYIKQNEALIKRNNELTEVLRDIVALDPSETEEGFNEWGEAHCFNEAQKIAKKALENVK